MAFPACDVLVQPAGTPPDGITSSPWNAHGAAPASRARETWLPSQSERSAQQSHAQASNPYFFIVLMNVARFTPSLSEVSLWVQRVVAAADTLGRKRRDGGGEIS